MRPIVQAGGRPKILEDTESRELREIYLRHMGSTTEFLRQIKIPRTTFYRYAKEWRVKSLRLAVEDLSGLPRGARQMSRLSVDRKVGFDLKIGIHLAKTLGFRPEVVPVSFAKALDHVENGRVDLAIARIGNTRERAKRMSFTSTYLPKRQTPMCIFAARTLHLPSSDPSTWAKLRFGVLQSSVSENYLRPFFNNGNLQPYRSEPMAFAALKTGDIDAVFCDEAHVPHGLAPGNLEIKPWRLNLGMEPCIAVAKRHESLLDLSSQVIEQAQKRGLIEAMFRLL